MFKKIHTLALYILLTALFLTACTATADKAEVRAAFLKGPTGMGAALLMEQNEKGEAKNDYTITVYGAPDAVLAQLITDELDIAALPTNTIATLHNKTDGDVQMLAVSTLGVLYLLERGDTVHSLADLSGKRIVAAAQGTTVEAVANRLFPEDAATDYVSEHTEALLSAMSGAYDLVLLPEPFVTQMLDKDDAFRVALDLTAAWSDSGAGTLVMGGIAVRREFAEAHPEAIQAFLSEYGNSIAYANENPSEAAKLIEKFDIMPAAVAEKAIPRANMTLVTGDQMRAWADGYLAVLFEMNTAWAGGSLPGDAFYAEP